MAVNKGAHRGRKRRRSQSRRTVLTAFCVALAIIMLALIVYVVVWYVNLGRIQRNGERYAELYGGRSAAPTLRAEATPEPAAEPTPVPTAEPTPVPAAEPTPEPAAEPTPVPTAEPTPVPTAEPTPVPTAEPTPVPTAEHTPVPTAEPTPVPTAEPTPVPTAEPTPVPTVTPVTNRGIIISGPALGDAESGLAVPAAVPGSSEAPTPIATPEPAPIVTPEPVPIVTPEPMPAVTAIPFGADMPVAEDVPIPTPSSDTLVIALPTAPPVQSTFAELLALNPETVGFLQIDDLLSLPVVQRENDNDYYLSHTFEGEEALEGTLFIDGMNRLVPEDDCLIVYGHNMKNKTMFGRLNAYSDVGFLRSHSVIHFDTLYENRSYVAFAAFTASMEPGNSRYFDVRKFIFDEAEFDKFVLKLQARSLYRSPIDVVYGDRLLLLVTCDYTGPEGRFILALRQLREDEAEMDVWARAVTTAVK